MTLRNLRVISLFIVDVKSLDFYINPTVTVAPRNLVPSSLNVTNRDEYTLSTSPPAPSPQLPKGRQSGPASIHEIDNKFSGLSLMNLRAMYLRSNRAVCPYSSIPEKVKRMMEALRVDVESGKGIGHLRKVVSQRPEERRQQTWSWRALWTQGPYTDREGLDALKDEGLGRQL
ncbi:hypothetical protein K435DRAFT_780585 [Dendrothele bispora CBS 962.96]|uniref:Uncharacterized protein n=1 Tax=Dendrothele bispora (strain CBS 962.96) TaxID=1314807 RepID=A0A4S8LS01_DENBC|nr:hypothetical protein K435DRAFT_780585 [Dendrothele bispora CBS 962.96]